MAVLTKEMINASDDFEYELVPVPKWGGEVRIRSLTGEQRSRLGKNGQTALSYDALVCSMGIVNDAGVPMYTEAEVSSLAKKNTTILDDLANRILALSGMTVEAQIETTKKRLVELEAILTSRSGSSSPAQSTPASDSTLTP